MSRMVEIGAIVVVAGIIGGLLMMHPWSGPGDAAGTAKAGDSFASDRAPAGPVPFDARRAVGYLEAICKIGPRISGSAGMKEQQELIRKHFEALGGTVRTQEFTARQRSVRSPTDMTNMTVSWRPERERRVILCSHYDTRPLADQEKDPRDWRKPFISANDGGSGVALLMELGHHMKKLPTNVGVDFVFFDGEEYVFDREDDYFFGSRHFGKEHRRAKGKTQYLGAILLDMVGGKDARFPIEQNSWNRAPTLVRNVWEIAAELKSPAFRADEFSRVPVEDDHVALNQSGIPAVDIIDFDYRHWHRLSDLPESCSGETLEQVARVLAVWLQRLR